MPPDQTGTSPEPLEDDVADAANAAGDAITAALAQVPDSVRNSPEYQALLKEHRKTVRKAGSLERQVTDARTAAEASRLAAEAERQAALEAQLEGELGEDGIAAFNELAELSATDPVAAARKFKELMARTQSVAGSEPPAAGTAATTGEANVGDQTPPPFPGGVDGNAPLGAQPQEDIEALTKPLDERYAATVVRNQDPILRNRVTMKERGDAMIAYLASAYIKAVGPRGTPRR